MSAKIILYLALSLDGFIADKDGGVAWLDEYNESDEDCGHKEFYAAIDALVMGKATYDQVLSFGPWAFSDKMSYVFVGQDTYSSENPSIQFVHTDVPDFMKDISEKNYKRLWLFGGAKLAESFYRNGLVDEYIFTIVPKKIGEGIALLPEMIEAKGMILIDEIQWPSGIIQKHFKREDA